MVYIIPAKIIDKTNKKRYMNIKLKAALTVGAFFTGLITGAWILTKIPAEWIINGFITLLAIAAVIVGYYVALGYYKDVEKLKKSKEQDRRKVEGQNSRIL
jgi:uncharacterized membrane protein YfcA